MYYKQNIHNILIIFTFTLIFLLNNLPKSVYSQVGGSTSEAVPQESVSILNPVHNQKFGIDEGITISGESSDTSEKDCIVAVIVNNIKPYQKAEPTGPTGTADYSEWKFILRESYTQLVEGQNKITAKLTCASAPTRWYSVFVTGLAPAGTNKDQDTLTDSNSDNPISPFENEDEGILSGLRSSQDSATTSNTTTSSSSIPDVTPNSNDNGMYVTIRPQKDPVARGDSQNVTISVADSSSRPITDASITGRLIYPGSNYEKDFSGSTDSGGRFAYSWIIGSDGKLGPLEVTVEITSPTFGSQSITKSFELIDSSGTSVLTKEDSQPTSNPVLTKEDSQPTSNPVLTKEDSQPTSNPVLTKEDSQPTSNPVLTKEDSQPTSNPNFISAKKSLVLNDKFHFAVAGDYGCDSSTQKTVNAMEHVNPNLVLALGDLSEIDDPDCFFDLFSTIDNQGKLKIALGEQDTDSGNEYDSSSRLSQFARHFDLGETFYSFDYKNIHFLAMSTGKNTMIPYLIGSPQYRFREV